MDFLVLDSQLRIIFQLFLAALLGGLVGLEREYQRRAAGLKTHSLVSLGSALFTIISLEAFEALSGKTGISFDPSRVVAAIVVGVGFIGAGLIILRSFRVEGLTTAAGIWVVAGVGVAVAFQFYLIAAFTAFLALMILTVLKSAEEKFLRNEEKKK